MNSKNPDNSNFLIKRGENVLPYFQFILLIFAVVLTLPTLIIGVSGGGLDQSWRIGLLKAADEGLIFGKNIVFTYGPLGFLTIPVFINKILWIYSSAYILAIYAITVLGFSLYLRKTKSNPAKTILFSIIFVAVFRKLAGLPPGSDFELVISTFIFSYLYTLGQRRIIPLLGLAFLYSILPFIKFSSVLGGGITGVVFLCILIKEKRGKEALTFLIAGVILFFTLGLLLLKSPKAIAAYLYGCWQIASGFNDAMGLDGNRTDILFAIFSWASYICMFCYCAFKKKRNEMIFLTLSLGALFLSFKQGFIRNDPEHAVYFYAMWLMVFGLYSMNSFAEVKKFGYIILLFTFILFFQYGTETASLPKLYSTASNLKDLRFSLNLLSNDTAAEQLTKMVKIKLQKYYGLKMETVKMLLGHTIDVFPSEIAITEAYNFNWHPRPVFQSFPAYTEYLDSLDAKYFLSDSSPEYILYALGAIDGRYEIFDEPATFRTLLLKYEPCALDRNFIVLHKKDTADAATEEYAGMEIVKFGGTIPLPKCSDGLLFAKIHIEHNLPGLVRKILYKSPNVYVTLFNNDKVIGTRGRKFVFSNAANGLFVSQYISDQNSLLEVWKGNIRQDITGILLKTKHPEFFKDKITVEFFKITKKY